MTFYVARLVNATNEGLNVGRTTREPFGSRSDYRITAARHSDVPPLLEKHSGNTFIGRIERGATFLTIISVQQG